MTHDPGRRAWLVEKYDRSGPRYTSYPTAPVWKEQFSPEDWAAALGRANQQADLPLGIYVHLPFCQKRCLFCACNVVISKREDIVEEYLVRLDQEIDRAARLLPERRKVTGVHWGGGTPTHLNCEQIQRVYGKLQEHFEICEQAEISIEVHPPVTTEEQLTVLRELGFNRVSLGVQDLDHDVQEVIQRHQSLEQTETVLETARRLGFRSSNFDLIHGLPTQTRATWEATLDEVLRMRPDRLAVYSYAHVPWLHPHQERMPMDQIPAPVDKAWMIDRAQERLVGQGGYVPIGFDHFALPEDELAQALANKRLYRNFMGYAVKPAPDYLGFGMTAISEVGGAFIQNQSKLNRWNEAVDQGIPPVGKGLHLSEDDLRRKWVIERLMCNEWLSMEEYHQLFGERFQDAFASAWKQLEEFESDGLVMRSEQELSITEEGRHFLRNVCMLFDAYLPEQEGHTRFSRTV